MDYKEHTIRKQTIHKGNITTYTVEEVRLPNGKKAIREIVRHDDASAVIPVTADGKLVLVGQYRKAIEQMLYEIPAGLMDEEDKSPLETAQRELEEETGYQAENWTEITGFYSSPGFTDEYLTLFEARELMKVEDPRPADQDEFLEVKEVKLEEAWQLYEEEKIADAKTVFALFYLKSKESEEKGIE